MVSDKDIAQFQQETDRVLKEHCLINIELLNERIQKLKTQIENSITNDTSLKFTKELLEKSEEELLLYKSELEYLNAN